MRVNNKKGAMIGTLVARVEVLEALVAGKTPKFEFTPKGLTTSAKKANKGGYKVRLAVKLTDGATGIVPYNGRVALTTNPTGGTVKAPETVEIKNGYGEFVAEYTGEWASANTCVYTIGAELTILEKPVTQGELTDTFGA